MAYWVEGREKCSIRIYACDFLSDIAKLPTQTKNGEGAGLSADEKQKCLEGSKCTCLEDGSLWKLGKESGWRKVGTASSGSDGGDDGGGGSIVGDVIYF